jgi:Coenzyme PQQ synthesis protein D (PqqD).
MLKARRNLITRSLNGETVILDRVSGQVHALNSTATCIWEVCDGQHGTDEIAAYVTSRFGDVPQNVRDDVVRALDEFERLGLLTTD